MEENGLFGAILKFAISIPNSYQTFRLSKVVGLNLMMTTGGIFAANHNAST